MAQFQGSGFSIYLPDSCMDASAYTFVLPYNQGFSANLTIRFEHVPDGYELEKSVKDELAALSNRLNDFTLISQNAGQREGNDGVIAVYEWGEGQARMRQRVITLLVQGDMPRKYILTTTDLVAGAEESDAVFNQILQSFALNDIQFF
ncbi:DcrB-related protein [Vibrio albus]|nr:DcrB-related protein [Vibrio albus]